MLYLNSLLLGGLGLQLYLFWQRDEDRVADFVVEGFGAVAFAFRKELIIKDQVSAVSHVYYLHRL